MAVSFGEALGIAKKCWDGVDYCTEYPGAFVFSKMDDMSFGGSGPVVVLKDSGKAINYVAFIGMGTGEQVREGYLKEFG